MTTQDKGREPLFTTTWEKYYRIAEMARNDPSFVERLKEDPETVMREHGIDDIDPYVLTYIQEHSVPEIFWKAHHWQVFDVRPMVN